MTVHRINPLVIMVRGDCEKAISRAGFQIESGEKGRVG
jgi:hypothetical protein